MDHKPPLPSGEFTTDVTPLPSAPPPTYEDACGAGSIYPAAPFPSHSTPLITENNQTQGTSPPTAANLPYPVQQVQITPAALAATVNRPLPVGRRPLKTTCTGCGHFISTRTRIKNRLSPTFWCVILFLTCLCIPCSCCPYFCCDKPMRIEHFCPRCNAFLGSYIDP